MTQKNTIIYKTPGAPKKYDFSQMKAVGDSMTFTGRQANSGRLGAAALGWSKRHYKGRRRYSCASGKDTATGENVVVMTRIA